MSAAGAATGKSVHVAPSGEFRIEGVPAGTYMLRATAFGREESGVLSGSPLGDALPVSLTSDVAGLALAMHPAIFAGVRVRDEIPPDGAPSHVHRVFVQMTAKEFEPFSQAGRVSTARGSLPSAGRI
jgi:hypothetical protein